MTIMTEHQEKVAAKLLPHNNNGRIETLPNGLVLVVNRKTGTETYLTQDGKVHSIQWR